jgi:NAD(P)-dependent dehydrogenase (short-subunit alcohol dehydrogenase family)
MRMSLHDLTGRTALVTGAATGIGAAIAEALAHAGATIVIADIAEEEGRKRAAALTADGAKASFVRLDVRSEAEWEAAAAFVIGETGGFDILVNNAGIEISALAIDANADDLRHMFDVNVVGTALGIKHAFRAMKPGGPAGRGGVILNIASVAATIAFPGISGYSATKSAVDRLTRIAAVEAGKLGYRVRVNCLYPGLVPTRMGGRLAEDMVTLGLAQSVDAAINNVVDLTPLGRLGELPDIADAAVFLCSDAARFVTGTGLSVDGGMGS